MTCNNGIIIPQLSEDVCNGETKNSKCVIHEDALVLLELPEDSSAYDIINAFYVSLSAALNRIESLETLTVELEARIVALENI
jgi:hypothetical protein